MLDAALFSFYFLRKQEQYVVSKKKIEYKALSFLSLKQINYERMSLFLDKAIQH